MASVVLPGGESAVRRHGQRQRLSQARSAHPQSTTQRRGRTEEADVIPPEDGALLRDEGRSQLEPVGALSEVDRSPPWLYRAMAQGRQPHYFVPQINLLDGIAPKTIENMKCRLERVLRLEHVFKGLFEPKAGAM